MGYLEQPAMQVVVAYHVNWSRLEAGLFLFNSAFVL